MVEVPSHTLQWFIEYQQLHEEFWISYARTTGEEATKTILKEMREESPGFKWRAIRIETSATLEDW